MRLANDQGNPDPDETVFRTASARAYRVLQERDPARQQARVAADLLELLIADSVQCYDLNHGDPRRGDCYGYPLPQLALAMQQELLPLALAAERSLLSSHRDLAPELAELAEVCREARVTTHLLLVRAYGETIGAFAVHWFGHERPSYQVRGGFYHYWDMIGFAFAATQERTKLQTIAYYDPLTGLPNSQALERELAIHTNTHPFSVLALDFDGLKQANTTHGLDGGDLLIKTVAVGLTNQRRPGEFVARIHSAGDEFVVLLPGLDDEAAAARAAELEATLDNLPVPEKLAGIYQGASVAHASRRDKETTGQVFGRAKDLIHARKLARKRRRRTDK